MNPVLLSKYFKFISLCICLIYLCGGLSGQSAIYSSSSTHHPIIGESGMVATQHALASEVGLEILKEGGNAVDASVAIGFALAVVLPRAGNLGGGGFMVLHDAENQKTTSIDYREMAPASAHRNMYLNKEGDVDEKKFNQSYHSVGVPGTVAGLIHALDNYGTMSLEQLIEPAIQLAENGFEVTRDLAQVLRTYEDRLKACPVTALIFFKGEEYYEAGDLLVQKDLAWSLKQIQKNGRDGFYSGKLAKKISKEIKANGASMTQKDFKNYRVVETEPIWGKYKGYEIASMPPPSSGGIHIVQMLNILENFSLEKLGHNSAQSIHVIVEAMRLAYADRSEHLGDPAFWEVPVKGLISKAYANELVKIISMERARKSIEIKPGNPKDFESEETTHFSVADKFGNVVSNTYTINFSFGSGLMAKGTGILLNNEMGDFSAKPGSANAYGLVGGEANSVEAGKRPLSSMTPTLVFKDGKVFLATGSPGGSRIITTVLQIILNVIDHEMNIAEATHATRIHHQWYPDVLYYERELNLDTRLLLERKGHTLKQRNAMGSTQSILIKDGLLFGSSDPRRPDGKALGY